MDRVQSRVTMTDAHTTAIAHPGRNSRDESYGEGNTPLTALLPAWSVHGHSVNSYIHVVKQSSCSPTIFSNPTSSVHTHALNYVASLLAISVK